MPCAARMGLFSLPDANLATVFFSPLSLSLSMASFDLLLFTATSTISYILPAAWPEHDTEPPAAVTDW